VKDRRARQLFVDAGAVFTLFVFLLPVWWTSAQDERLSTNGETTTGVVQKKIYVRGGNDSSPDYYVEYSFADAAGREHRARKLVESSLYEKLSPEDPLPIQYLVDDPGTSRIVGAYGPSISEAVALAGMGLVVFYFLGPLRWLRELRGRPDPALT
jgi:hypothetical protein